MPRSKEKTKEKESDRDEKDGRDDVAEGETSNSFVASPSVSAVAALAAPGISAGAAEGEREKKRSKDKDARPAEIRGSSAGSQSFRVVYSVILLVEIFLQYLDLALNFPEVTTEIIGKVVELLRLFDSKTKQLVLGAQAVKSAARLKNISAKHLAITSQSVGLLLALLPHIRTALLVQLPPKQHMLLTELDRVSHGLIDHHNQLLAKLVSIVGGQCICIQT